MDTRFWGPSGWALLHLIAAAPIEQTRQAAVKQWFDLLEYILPCKYCRASFHDYTKIQPLTPTIIKNPDTFGRWVYDIHNRVNAKLRGQGLLTTQDPSWSSVKSKYNTIQKSLCSSSPLLGWDFMTSVAFTTPGRATKTTPMPDAPENGEPLSFEERNRYNLLSREERINQLRAWWGLIPTILPCLFWRAAWASAVQNVGPAPLESPYQKAIQEWMWQIEEQVCAGLKCPTPHTSKTALAEEVSAFESDCSKKPQGKTCRARKHKRRLQAMAKRTRRLQSQKPAF
jgi:hypothetical protein